VWKPTRSSDTFTAPIKGNTSRIEIPIKPEYEPNVYVSSNASCVRRLDQLAGEMYGYDQLAVQSADRALDVSVKTGRAEFEPREKSLASHSQGGRSTCRGCRLRHLCGR
jgi:uncharacterized protein YfaS (alpha-2-macroglobulin family)